jgi:hypothetical protein
MNDDVWMTRAEVADRFRKPASTLAQWASKGLGPRYAIFGKSARYRLSDVVNWENAQFVNHTARLAEHEVDA